MIISEAIVDRGQVIGDMAEFAFIPDTKGNHWRARSRGTSLFEEG